MRVLLVDDNPFVLKSLSQTVAWDQAGCHLIGTAADGEIALTMIHQERPDIVIADICMPGLDGLSLLERLKNELDHPPVTIFITGYESFHFAQTALRLGAFNYITKPIDNMELQGVLLDAAKKAGEAKKQQGEFTQIVTDNEEKTKLIELNRNQMIKRLLVECMEGKVDSLVMDNHIRQLDINHPCYLIYLHNRHQAGTSLEDVQNAMASLQMHTRASACIEVQNGILIVLFVDSGTQWESVWRQLHHLMALPMKSQDIQFKRMEGLDGLSEEVELLALRAGPSISTADAQPLGLPQGMEWENCPLIVRKALSYISNNIDQKLSLNTVAGNVKVSPNYLSSLIHKKTGFSFTSLIQNMRIDRAKRLLADPALRVYEVGLKIGCDNYSHFYQVFKQTTGLSPTEFRNMVCSRSKNT